MKNDSVLRRYQQYQQGLQNDPKGLELLEAIKKYALEYVRLVESHEGAVKTMVFRLDPDQFRERVRQLDLTRRLAHNALIDALKIFHRYIAKNYEGEFPATGLFTESKHIEQGRVGITEWAIDFKNELSKKTEEHQREHIKKTIPKHRK